MSDTCIAMQQDVVVEMLKVSANAVLQQRWQQRLDRAETLLQQQSERTQTLASGQDANIDQLRSQLDNLNQTVRNLDDSLSTLKTEKLSLSRENEQLRDEKGALQGEGQDLRGLIEVLRGSVRGLTQNAHQVNCCWISFAMHVQQCCPIPNLVSFS